MARRPYQIETRFILDYKQIEELRSHCSPSSQWEWVCTYDRLRRHTIKGVPGKHIDVLLPDQMFNLAACEIGLVTGSYNGVKRWRLTVRNWLRQAQEGQRPNLDRPGPGRLKFEEHENDHLVILAMWYGNGFWAQSFPRLRFTVEDGDRRGIMMHHYYRYYRFLPEEDVRQLAEMWSLLPMVKNGDDIVVLNRLAGEALYDLARQLGWRKLTLREKKRLGLDPDSPQWQRKDTLPMISPRSPTGCGEYTLRAASGTSAMY